MKKVKVLEGNVDIEVDEVLKHVHFQGQDVVVLSGTLIEGIGNRLSDIDVHVFCKQRIKFDQDLHSGHAYLQQQDMSLVSSIDDEIFLTMDYYKNGEFSLDIEYWTFREFEDICDKISDNFRKLCDHSDVDYSNGGLSELDQRIFNRASYGVTLMGDSSWVAEKTGELSPLYAYMLYRRFANNYWKFKDICGAINSEDPETICYLANDFLVDEIRAAVHLNGVINSTKKWYLKHWARIGKSVYSSIYEKSIELIFGANLSDSAGHVRSVLEVVENIEEINRRILADTPKIPKIEQQLSRLDKEISDRYRYAGAAQDHEFAFRSRTFGRPGKTYVDLLKI